MKSLIFALLLAANNLSHSASAKSAKPDYLMYITADSLWLKEKPSTSSEDIKILRKGNLIPIYDHKNHFDANKGKSWYFAGKGYFCAHDFLNNEVYVSFKDPIEEHFKSGKACYSLARHYAQEENRRDEAYFLKQAEEEFEAARAALFALGKDSLYYSKMEAIYLSLGMQKKAQDMKETYLTKVNNNLKQNSKNK